MLKQEVEAYLNMEQYTFIYYIDYNICLERLLKYTKKYMTHKSLFISTIIAENIRLFHLHISHKKLKSTTENR